MHTIQSSVLLGRSRVNLRPSRGTGSQRIVGWLVMAWNTLVQWQRRADERHVLSQLDRRQLADIGLTADDVAAEAGKPFWQA